MTAIARQSAKIFAQNAPVGQVTAFRTTESTPQTTKAPDQIQNENYLQGWLNADGSGNVLPYAEDMNGLFYTLSYNTAYLYEKGIPEYSSTQTYYLNSFCQYSGTIYRCKGDSVINIAPTNTNYWDALPSSYYTATTVGAATSNYGTVYAGTNTAGTQFQFKTIIGGSNVTISETADSLTISSTGGGGGTAITASAPLVLTNNVLSIPAATSSQSGYLTAADWASFDAKLSSTIFSASNSWTGDNTWTNTCNFSDITLKGVGVTSIKLEGLYTNLAAIKNSSGTVFATLGQDGLGYGLFPVKTAGTSYVLGQSSAYWDYGYINTLWGKYLTPTYTSATSSYFNLQYADSGANGTTFGYMGNYSGTVGIFPSTTNTGSLGSSSLMWGDAFLTKATIAAGSANGISFGSNSFVRDETGNSIAIGSTAAVAFYIGTTKKINLSTDRFIPDGATALGDPTHYWTNIFGSTLVLNNNNNINISTTPHVSSAVADIAINWGYGTGGQYKRGVAGYHDAFMPQANNALALGADGYRWSQLFAVSSTINTSDRRLKDNIEPLDDALIKLNSIDVKSYTLKGFGKHINYGFIAQDELERNPELVYVPDNYSEKEGGGYLGVVDSNVLFLAVKAIQEISAKVEDLQQQLMELKK